MTSLIDVMAWKYGGKHRYRVGDTYDTLVWEDESPCPTQEQLKLDEVEYLAYRAKTDYIWKRRNEYPSIDDLVVALWEQVIEQRSDSSIALQAIRESIKQKYPKPEEL